MQINFDKYIDLTFKKIQLLKTADNKEEKDYDDYSKKYLSFSNLSKFCRAIIIFYNKFSNKKHISENNIIDFCFELLFENEISTHKNIEINNLLKNELLEANNNLDDTIFKNEEKYFFKNSEKLVQLMIHLYASSMINQHLCIIGPPGIGKTLSSRAFSFIREIINGRKNTTPFYMNTFNEHTRPNDYYGVASLRDDKLIFRDGNLTKCLKQGNIFIADEFNISSEDCMKCVAPSLELNYCENMYIPGVEGKIKIDPDFFFIICQNTKDTFGRKDLPEIIKNKVKIIFYPERIQKEIEDICVDMYNYIFPDKIKNFENDVRLCGKLMMKINEIPILTPWSLRDIYKLLRRLYKQFNNKDKYKNLGLKENILFYITSSIHESLIEEQLSVIIRLIKEVFKLSDEEEKNLILLYKLKPIITNIEGNIFLKKNSIEINLETIEDNIIQNIKNLPTLLEAFFKILISSYDEPILLSGPTCYKTFL